MPADAVILAGLLVTAIGTLGAVAIGIGNLFAGQAARRDQREDARLAREDVRLAREAAQAASTAAVAARVNIQASTDTLSSRLDGGLQKLTDALELVAEARGREAGRLEGKEAAEAVQDRVDAALATPPPSEPQPVIVVGQTEPLPVVLTPPAEPPQPCPDVS